MNYVKTTTLIISLIYAPTISCAGAKFLKPPVRFATVATVGALSGANVAWSDKKHTKELDKRVQNVGTDYCLEMYEARGRTSTSGAVVIGVGATVAASLFVHKPLPPHLMIRGVRALGRAIFEK